MFYIKFLSRNRGTPPPGLTTGNFIPCSAYRLLKIWLRPCCVYQISKHINKKTTMSCAWTINHSWSTLRIGEILIYIAFFKFIYSHLSFDGKTLRFAQDASITWCGFLVQWYEQLRSYSSRSLDQHLCFPERAPPPPHQHTHGRGWGEPVLSHSLSRQNSYLSYATNMIEKHRNEDRTHGFRIGSPVLRPTRSRPLKGIVFPCHMSGWPGLCYSWVKHWNVDKSNCYISQGSNV